MFQTRLYTDSTDVLCGRRGPHRLIEMPRANLTKDETAWECPTSGKFKHACSTNVLIEGRPYCAESASTCPITEVYLLDDKNLKEAEFAAKASDSRYTTVRSARVSDNLMTLVYTRESVITHQPVSQIQWNIGIPCVFTDQKPYYKYIEPSYYVLERDKMGM